jgi:predicted O-linked N-acetylglucosamine transferase (SPINDLY family)
MCREAKLFELGLSHQRAGRHGQAVGVYRELLAARRENGDAWSNLGVALKMTGDLDGAIEAFGRAVELRPGRGDVYAFLGHALRDAGRLEEAIPAYRRGVEIGGDVRAADSLLVALHAHPGYGRAELYAEHEAWARRFIGADQEQGSRSQSPLTPALSGRERGKGGNRLKVGYVAADLGNHPLGRFLLPVVENHDREGFAVYCYNDHAREDYVTGRLRAAVEHWRSCGGMSHEELAAAIHGDGIDILVDLTMHGPGSRLLAFARKPAPVQVTYLAYASTTGVRAIDYRLTDAYLDPVGVDESLYFEQSVRLPHTWWCYPEPAEAGTVGPLPVDKNGYVTFGCLNSFGKTNPQMMGLWAEVMRNSPGSRLILHAQEGGHRQRVRESFVACGVEAGRVEFVGFLPVEKYLEVYGRIDVALDTYPWAGGATTCDALWMGVPVVSLAGETAVSRGGYCILSNIELGELVGHRPHEFVRIAAGLSVQRLRELRVGLRDRMKASKLMDGRRFAQGLEDAYRGMRERAEWR